ncbi:hypothetical protein F5B20DRAFT_563607 [Whalleya microplaca]|nr:hypothetical protein F5B20DRAFT_563607 [Whalleya microplaca]
MCRSPYAAREALRKCLLPHVGAGLGVRPVPHNCTLGLGTEGVVGDQWREAYFEPRPGPADPTANARLCCSHHVITGDESLLDAGQRDSTAANKGSRSSTMRRCYVGWVCWSFISHLCITLGAKGTRRPLPLLSSSDPIFVGGRCSDHRGRRIRRMS